MNREISFRAWHKKEKIIIIIDAVFFTDNHYIGHTDNGYHGSGSLDDIELLQCTGLKDKNGKLIFEGDIVKTLHGNFEVFWREKFASFAIRKPDKPSEWIDLLHAPGKEYQVGNMESFEIIGNIYENPELL